MAGLPAYFLGKQEVAMQHCFNVNCSFLFRSATFQTQIVHIRSWSVRRNTVFPSAKYGIHLIHFQDIADENYVVKEGVSFLQIRFKNNEERSLEWDAPINREWVSIFLIELEKE